jgi:hypothetical protein
VVDDEVRELVRRLVDEVIAEYDDRSLTGSLAQLVDDRRTTCGHVAARRGESQPHEVLESPRGQLSRTRSLGG